LRSTPAVGRSTEELAKNAVPGRDDDGDIPGSLSHARQPDEGLWLVRVQIPELANPAPFERIDI
jgi:hypothetical protein